MSLKNRSGVSPLGGRDIPDPPKDWAGALWIGGSTEIAIPQLRREFVLNQSIARVQLHVCGLGVSRVLVNGRMPSEVVLDPPPTAYHRRVLFRSHDVTRLMRQGGNTLAVTLAPGWHGLAPEATLYWKDAPWLGRPRLLALLIIEYADGHVTEVISDESWRVHGGPATAESVFSGEVHDNRLATLGWALPGYDDAGWASAYRMEAPVGALERAWIEPIRVTGVLEPEQNTQPRPGSWVYRFPVMATGWVRLGVRGVGGAKVTVRYGERLNADGTVNTGGDPNLTVGEIQTDTFILRGGGPEELEPWFTYKGFQFVQVDGVQPDQVQAMVAHTDVASVGEFGCSDPLANTLQAMARRSILNCLHGLPEDTPVFEKRGWLGDAHLTAETAMDNFAMREVYAKWLRDVADGQAADGNIGVFAPAPVAGDGADPAWGAAYVLIPWLVFQRYGDRALLAEHYEGMRRYVDYLARSAADGLVPPALFGDWVAPGHGEGDSDPFPPEGQELCSAAYYYRVVTVMQRIATALGSDVDARADAELAARLKAAFHHRFFHGTGYATGRGNYRQTSNVLPLAFGLVPAAETARVLDGLVADIRAKGNHLDTGVLGTKELLPVLTEHGHVDLAWTVFTQRTPPGFGYWVEQGATTLWEAWQHPRSRDHHMYGSFGDWLFTYIAGIRVSEPGYAAIRVQPVIPSQLTSAHAAIETVRGRVASSWRVTDDAAFQLDVTVPADVRAEVVLPGSTTPVTVGHGEHRFTLPPGWR